LLSGFDVQRVRVLLDIDEMCADVILDHFGHQSGHGAVGARDEMHDLFAVGLTIERPLDGFDLPSETAKTGKQLLPVLNRMRL
jgi:hypothetical protein